MTREENKMGIGKIILIILSVLIVGGGIAINAFLNKLKSSAEIHELSAEHQTGVWYRFTPEGAIDSIGEQWHGLIRFGTENKVIINFYGGGVSINEETARGGEDFYFHTMGDGDFAQLMGISAYADTNPLKDWTIINVPYCTGDWHIGTNDYTYTDAEGKQQVLHHHGYTNFKLMMEMLKDYLGSPDTLLVTGWSGGGFGASFLAEEIFEDYFPNVENKNVLVDAAFLLKDDWKDIADNVWGSPSHIAERFTGNNLVMDSLHALSVNIPDAKILFLCSIRDEALTKYQNYLDTGVFEATEEKGKEFEQNLKVMMADLLSIDNTAAFIWNDKENDTALTTHTVTMIQFCDAVYGGVRVSDWLMDAINGNLVSYGVN